MACLLLHSSSVMQGPLREPHLPLCIWDIPDLLEDILGVVPLHFVFRIEEIREIVSYIEMAK